MGIGQTQEFWQAHLDEWKRSGLTQVAYCANHGLHVKAFSRWLSKARKSAQPPDALLTLIPLRVTDVGVNGVLQLHSPGGWRIELPATNTAWLAGLLKQLP